MQSETSRFDELVAQLRALPSGDRKAVLARIPLEQRYSVEKMLRADPVQAEEEAPVAGKRFAHYSSNLARLVTAIDAGDPLKGVNGRQPTAATCAALLLCAEEIQKKMDKDASTQSVSFFDSIRALIFGPGGKA